MKAKLFGSFLILVLLFVGCSDDNSVTDPTGGNSNSSKVTFTGAENGSYDAEVGILNAGDGALISLSEKNSSDRSLLLGSSIVTTGTFTIPDQYEATYTNLSTNKIYTLFSGTVKINSISATSISGSINGSGYGLDLSNFKIDSTKVLKISAEFSL